MGRKHRNPERVETIYRNIDRIIELTNEIRALKAENQRLEHLEECDRCSRRGEPVVSLAEYRNRSRFAIKRQSRAA